MLTCSPALRRGLFVFRFARTIGKSICGITGFYLGTQVGIALGTDAVSYRFKQRPACRDAIALVRDRPHIAKWKRFYEGDRSCMVDLVYPLPPEGPQGAKLVQSALDRFDGAILASHTASSITADVANVAALETGVAEYNSRLEYARQIKTQRAQVPITERIVAMLDAVKTLLIKTCESTYAVAGHTVNNLRADVDGSQLSKRFLNSYAVYQSNDYRRPFPDHC